MRCKGCDYPLWNLTTRQCPECGDAFRPSDYEFMQNSVQFCCAGCGQTYFGTDPKGHLEPPEFDCVNCGNHLRMDELVLRPAEGVEEAQTRRGRLPWTERAERGRISAWLAMLGMGLVQPRALMRATAPGTSLPQAWRFAIVTQLVITVAAVIPMLCLMAFPLAAAGRSGGGQVRGSVMVGSFAFGAVATVLVGFVFTLVGIWIWGVVTHGILRLTGTTAEPLRHTIIALCYCSGANIVSAVPCIGRYFGWIWWVVSATCAVQEGQRVSGVRASLATLALPVGFLLVTVVSIVSFSMAMTNLSRASVSSVVGQAEITVLIGHLEAYGAAHGGRMPAHACELMPGSGVGGGVFMARGSATTLGAVPITDMPLS